MAKKNFSGSEKFGPLLFTSPERAKWPKEIFSEEKMRGYKVSVVGIFRRFSVALRGLTGERAAFLSPCDG